MNVTPFNAPRPNIPAKLRDDLEADGNWLHAGLLSKARMRRLIALWDEKPQNRTAIATAAHALACWIVTGDRAWSIEADAHFEEAAR